MSSSRCLSGALLLAATTLMGCREESAGEPAATRAFQVEAVTSTQASESVVLSGSIAAQVESNLSFRTGGRVIELLADVGSHVRKGDILARIDAMLQQADVESARAEVEAGLDRHLEAAQLRIGEIKQAALADVGQIAEAATAEMLSAIAGLDLPREDIAGAVRAVRS